MEIRSALKELCEAFNAHDLDRIMAVFSDDCVLEMPRGSKPWGSRFEGKQDVRKALATRLERLARCPLLPPSRDAVALDTLAGVRGEMAQALSACVEREDPGPTR